VLSLAFLPVLRAQIIEVTAEGIVATASSAASEFGVQPGDLFTETFEINSATPVTPNGGGVGVYDGLGADSVTAGTFTMSSPDATSVAQIYSEAPNECGYHLIEAFDTVVPVYADIYLLGGTPAVAPTTSLSSISEFPLTDFGQDADMDYIDNVDDFGFAAEISSYTVTTIAAPEPSSWVLVLIGIGSVLQLRRRAVRT